MSPSKPDAVIFDMDGTLVDVRGIRHYVLGERKDFQHFHLGASLCPPNHVVLRGLDEYSRLGTKIIIVTARKERWRYLTLQWLRKWEVPYDAFYMRPEGDNRKDYVVKAEILDQIEQDYNVIHAVDDNPAVIELWKSRGIPVTVVPGWIVG